MKIVLIGNYPPDGSVSMRRYADFLEGALKRAGHEVRLVQPRVFVRKLLADRNRYGKWLGYIDKFVLFRVGFPRLIRGADLVHVCDHSNSPCLSWIKSVPKVITCHDALAIRSALGHYRENPTGWSGRVLQKWIRRNLQRADRVIYVSDKTRMDFERVLGITAPSEVILNCLNWPYSVSTDEEIRSGLKAFGLERSRYMVHVGSNTWYKNRMGVLRMYAILREHEPSVEMRLVMAGEAFTAEMRAWQRTNGLDSVLELVNISNDQLRILYSGAFALLFPSLEEGFGWPVLEAQACGCPVITSNRPPLTEVAGAGALYIDPEKPESIIDAVVACQAERDTMIAAGFRNLARFQADDVICRYEKAYERAISFVEAGKGNRVGAARP